MVNIRVDFDDLLDEDWSRRFGQALADIRADMPGDINEDELAEDVESAINESDL